MNYYKTIKEDNGILNLIFNYIKKNHFSDIEIELISEDFDIIGDNAYKIKVNDISEPQFENIRLMEINFYDDYEDYIYPFIFFNDIPNYNRKMFIKNIKSLFIYHNRIKIIDSI